ncbi:hypothetical protein [Embleya sp. NPDC005971]|uniref:hypothetical protein n=1 Tax=Embleya sp. NPDC005971 TaxID=3156724 RepID=UPI0033ED0F16
MSNQPIPTYFLGDDDVDDEWLHITPIDRHTTVGVTLTTGPLGRRIDPDGAESVIAAIRRGCNLDPAPAPGRLDLAPIIADLHASATPPNGGGGLVDVTLTDSFHALGRIVDRHVLDLLAEVTMLRNHLAGVETAAALDRVRAEDDDAARETTARIRAAIEEPTR